MGGLIFDTGALIALERRSRRMRAVVQRAAERGRLIFVPAPVLLEWWRGDNAMSRQIFAAVHVTPLDQAIAQVAGSAMAKVKHATPIDAAVMATAAVYGDIVYTSDVADLSALQEVFRNVRVLAV